MLNVKYIQLYFGLQVVNGKQVILPLRLVNNYKDQDWIFFDEISYLVGSRNEVRQGKGVLFKIQDIDTNRNINRGVIEYSDIEVDENIKKFIKYVLNNKETGLSIRYLNTDRNTYREIIVLNGTKKLKKHFKALIDSYNILDKFYNLNNPF